MVVLFTNKVYNSRINKSIGVFMKRFLCIFLAALFLISALASCVSKEQEKKEEQTTTSKEDDSTVPSVDPNAVYMGDYFDYDLSNFVEMPKLSDIVVEKALVEQLLELNTALTLSSIKSFSALATGDVAAKYDTVNIDFKGRPKDESVKLEEDVLKGMESKDYEIMLGSGTFIGAYDHKTDDSLDTKGFEEQMIGMKVGETKDILVTFPDNYGEVALAGMQTVFEVTVNSANRPKEIDEETAKEQGYESVAAFNDELLRLTKSQASMEVVFRSATIKEYPAGDIELLYEYYIESYLDYYYGTNLSDEEAEKIIETLKEPADTWAKEYAKERMITKHIVDMQGVKVTEKDLADYAQREAEKYGIGSGDTLIAYYGKDTVVYDYLYELALEAVEKSVTFEK